MSLDQVPKSLIAKYDKPGPRYTSYPTVPAWKNNVNETQWLSTVREALKEDSSLSLYFHIPYCESLCTFCGCNVKITKDHALSLKLIAALHAEFQIYRKIFLTNRPVAKEIHFGGGTPTWLQPSELETLLAPYLDHWLIRDQNMILSMEVDPRVTTEAHLDWLQKRKFNRISLGVQDFDPAVMKAVNREQPFDLVQTLMVGLRKRGIENINFDLIYGLPNQTPETITSTMKQVIELAPSRIAFYSYAHVPWIRPAQKILEKGTLPLGTDKRMLYEIGRNLLEESGYIEIGLDHFAKKDDELFQALGEGGLHRNFMGYTVQKTPLLLGLGPSSISDSWNAFIQNDKDHAKYFEMIESGHLAIANGHLLSENDLRRRRLILDLMCRLEADLGETPSNSELETFAVDGLIQQTGTHLRVTELGRTFIRNICMTFDEHLRQTLKTNPTLYSRTV